MLNNKNKFHKVFLVSFCLVVATIVSYMPIIHSDFVGYDDELYVTENYNVQKGFAPEAFKWAFTTFHSANWHPLTWLSHMLDYELYGLNPMGHHWMNLQLHIANSVLLFFILQAMTGALWRSAFVAALFALHPLHVESVAWISERKDVLCTFFGLLMILAYYHYVKKPEFWRYAWVMIFFILGLMAKPMLVTFPFVLLLLDFWPLERFQYKDDHILRSKRSIGYGSRTIGVLILEKVPFFIPVIISCVLTFLAQKSSGAVQALEALSLKTRVANALVSYVKYVVKAVWPSKLAVFYPHPGNTLALWQILGSTLVIACACFWGIRTAKKYPYITIGLFWYLGTLVPVIGLIQVGNQAMADRYTYIPLIGIFILVTWGVADLFKKGRGRKFFCGIFASLILTVLTVNTLLQLRHWKNGITLFEHAVRVIRNNYQAENNLGAAFGKIDLDKAIFHYKESLKINPDYVTALYNLGTAFSEKGNYTEANKYLSKAVKINPQKLKARNNLANVLFLSEKPDEAILQYKEILKINSKNANAHYNLAHVLLIQGKTDEAVSHYKEALRINPEFSKAHLNLGNIFLKQGKLTESLAHFTEAIRISPDYAEAYNNIGCILFRKDKFKAAEVFFSKAIQINPNYTEARKNLEIIKQTLMSNKL